MLFVNLSKPEEQKMGNSKNKITQLPYTPIVQYDLFAFILKLNKCSGPGPQLEETVNIEFNEVTKILDILDCILWWVFFVVVLFFFL